MKKYYLETEITVHDTIAARILFEILKKESKNKSLINILKIDLSFKNRRIYVHEHIDVENVEYMYDNMYCLHYSLEWDIENGCVDMKESGTHDTTMNFEVHDDYLDFDLIDNLRDTTDEF
ncbi:hypothetical protein AB6866_04730 [Rahnella inusitata]|uniref:hypothetical protein n=1 Tax=Rahnella inusitata TaxID=58169 RepID=UPI0039BDB41B